MICLLAYLLAGLLACLLTYLLTCLLTYLLACLLTCLLAYLLTYWPACLPACLLTHSLRNDQSLLHRRVAYAQRFEHSRPPANAEGTSAAEHALTSTADASSSTAAQNHGDGSHMANARGRLSLRLHRGRGGSKIVLGSHIVRVNASAYRQTRRVLQVRRSLIATALTSPSSPVQP